MPCPNRKCDGPLDPKRCPGLRTAARLGPNFRNLLADYHANIWREGGAIPLKLKYLMALATAVTGREVQRAKLEANKAVACGATDEEIRETLAMGVWLGGAPLLLEVVNPVLAFVAKRRAATGDS